MIGLLAGIVLGVVVILAGAAKVAMGDRWPIEARAMGAPSFVVPVVPWIEIALGAALVGRIAPIVSGSLALALIASFTTLILFDLSRGRRPVCACFGQWRAAPLGWRHVVRNVVLMALAVAVIVLD